MKVLVIKRYDFCCTLIKLAYVLFCFSFSGDVVFEIHNQKRLGRIIEHEWVVLC